MTEISSGISHEVQSPDLLDTHSDLSDTQADFELGSGLPSAAGKDSISDDSAWATSPPSAAMTLLPSLEPDELSKLSIPLVMAAAAPVDLNIGDFRVGDLLGNRYEVRHVLRGGMGIIYLCYDRDAHETVAIKTFQGRFLENERAVARFVQEAHTWIRLEKHNHIVQARLVKELGNERVQERPHIVLEHIVGPEGLGPDLKSWIDHNRLDLTTSIEIALQICLGMQHAVHMVPGLVHRDLKPANILVRYDGLAKVTDFGLAHSMDSEQIDGSREEHPTDAPLRLTRAGAVVGTAPYMSPEQCQADPVDLRSDIYAFGAIIL
jgi:serine/threonine protein kinase